MRHTLTPQYHHPLNPTGHRHACPVPLSPKAFAQLRARYQDLVEHRRIPASLTFEQYYYVWRSRRRGENVIGLDDGAVRPGPSTGAQLITRPTKKLRGTIRTLVLLVDFPDHPHSPEHTVGHFEQMLFSADTFTTGSMRDYYRLVSGFDAAHPTEHGIDIQGEVHGWFRLPQPLSFYTDNQSGTGNPPRNSQGMAADALRLALDQGIDFSMRLRRPRRGPRHRAVHRPRPTPAPNRPSAPATSGASSGTRPARTACWSRPACGCRPS